MRAVGISDALSAAKAALGDVSAHWNRAEELIKQAERVRGEVVQPSINELRYAGRRLIDAWLLIDEAEQNAEAKEKLHKYVTDAIFRCHCAQHDAIDATVLFVQLSIREYEREFGHALLLQHFPSVPDLRKLLADAGRLITASRAERERRHDDYERLGRENLPLIIDSYELITSNRESLESMVRQQQERAEADRLEKERLAEAERIEKDRIAAGEALRDKRDSWRFKYGNWLLLGYAILGAAAGVLIDRAIPKKEASAPPLAVSGERPSQRPNPPGPAPSRPAAAAPPAGGKSLPPGR